MKILKREQVASIPLGMEAIEMLYGDKIQSQSSEDSPSVIDVSVTRLKSIINLFERDEDTFKEDFQCFIECKAFRSFIEFADKAYNEHGFEATGVIFGYYFHLKNNPQKKIVVATDFIAATGPATSVTCSISYDDVIKYSNFCEENNMIQAVWIHSHPTYGTFYSGTDSAMLSSSFYANHQMGVVVDNIRNQAMGFKIYAGVEMHENVILFDMDESLLKEKLQTQVLFQKHKKSETPMARQQKVAPPVFQVNVEPSTDCEQTVEERSSAQKKKEKEGKEQKEIRIVSPPKMSSKDTQKQCPNKKDKISIATFFVKNLISKPLSIREYLLFAVIVILIVFICSKISLMNYFVQLLNVLMFN